MYLFGLPWLYASLANFGEAVWSGAMGYDSVLAATIGAGFVPFIIGDIVKALLAAALVPLAWKSVRALDARK
ncbi:MAG: biotin transporter BioY, partial [Actinobacteria bacterium]|nr:biotin transporter BioY [Actinomycetota bacterium]